MKVLRSVGLGLAGIVVYGAMSLGALAQSLPGRILDGYTGLGVSNAQVVGFKDDKRFSVTVQDGNYVLDLSKPDGIEATPTNGVAETFDVRQNYPNPFSNGTNIEFSVPRHDHVTIGIYDILGRKVKTVLDQELHQGVYRTGFSINDIPNMASGIYFLRVTGEKYSKAIKMVHTKTGVETHVNLNLEQIANTASTKFVPMRKMSYEDLAVLDSMQVKGNDIVDTTVVPQVNNGQIADINVTPAVHITGMTEGVDSDSGAANMPLADADVWIGTRDKNAQGNFKTKTNADGSYDLKVPKGQPGTFHQDTLFVEAQGYNQRSKLTNRYSNQEENTQSITDKVIIDLFNRLYLNGGLCKPDTNVITFYVKPNAQYNVPDIMWNKYIDRAIAKLESTTGGIYRGERTTDSAKAYNITEFMILQHNGDTWMADIGFYRLPEDWTTIIGSNTRFNPVTNPMFEPDIALSSDKEELNIFGKGDINESDVPASWKESIQYVANDRILKTEYPKIDIDMDRVAAKLPRGYAANTTYVPK